MFPVYTPMGQMALEAYDLTNEEALIHYLSVFARSESDHLAWTNSGVCILIDGGAVVQDDDTYTFRWTGEDGQKNLQTRSAELPQDDRKYHHYQRGPLFQWPNGESLWETALGLRAQDLEEMVEDQAQEAGIPVPTVNEWDGRNLTNHRLIKLVPEFADAVDMQVPSETENAGIDFDMVDCHMIRLAQAALASMDPQVTLKLDRTLALAALEFEGEDEAAKALANHWDMELPR